MSDFNFAVADKYQLKFWAKEQYDLALSLAMGEDTMRERIVAHCTKNDIEAPVGEVAGKKVKGVKYVTINIAKSEKKDGAIPVFVGVQGFSYLVPRGIDVKVPPSVVEVLKNAVQDIITQDIDTGELMHEDVPTYPFQIVHNPNSNRQAA